MNGTTRRSRRRRSAPTLLRRVALATAGAGSLGAAGVAAQAPGPPPSARDIELQVVVDASPAEAWAAWVEEERVDRFFGVASRIEPRPGGAYEIRFRPGDDEASRANSTVGSRILGLEEGRWLAFGWSLPPWAEEPARSAPPTRVDVQVGPALDPAAGGRTLVRVRHSGFGEGDAWEQVRSFFHRSWFEILKRYQVAVAAM